MPEPQQSWSHGTNSLQDCLKAMNDNGITAIEADIVMGRDVSSSDIDNCVLEPIMSHPPDYESDLSAATFLDHATRGKERRVLKKHIKLDFKDFDAVEPTLQAFKNLNVTGNGSSTVFLNADVLHGPGKTPFDVTISADAFVEKCLEMVQSGDVPYAFSLGFKVEVHSPKGHTNDHLEAMAAVVKRHNLLERSAGKKV